MWVLLRMRNPVVEGAFSWGFGLGVSPFLNYLYHLPAM